MQTSTTAGSDTRSTLTTRRQRRRPWLQFSLRSLLLAALIVCVVVALLRPRSEPPPRVEFWKSHIQQNDKRWRTYLVHFADGTTEAYMDFEPYGSLDELNIVYENKYLIYYADRPGRPVPPDKQLTKNMYKTFQRLSETINTVVDVESLPNRKRVRVDLPRDFPKLREPIE